MKCLNTSSGKNEENEAKLLLWNISNIDTVLSTNVSIDDFSSCLSDGILCHKIHKSEYEKKQRFKLRFAC